MKPWLLINPNTTEAVTQALLQRLCAGAESGSSSGVGDQPLPWQAITAGFGAAYIADERGFCIAGHAVLDAWERAQSQEQAQVQAQAQVQDPADSFGGVLVGCFGDPGLEALRASTTLPVWGLAEASLHALWQRGAKRVAIVTGGLAWQTMLQRWSRAHGFDKPAGPDGCCIAAIHVLEASGGQMMASPDAAVQALSASCQQALQGGEVDAVLLGGAGLAGMGQGVRTATGLEVWDCVELVQAHWAKLVLCRNTVRAQENYLV